VVSDALTERVLEACVRRKVPVFYQAEMVAADGVSQRHSGDLQPQRGGIPGDASSGY